MDYSKLHENQVFQKNFTGRFLAYKVLALNVPEIVIPVDMVEVHLFYKRNFKGQPKDTFKRFCEFHELDEEETIQHYKNTLKWDAFYPKQNLGQNLTDELQCLNDCFFRML